MMLPHQLTATDFDGLAAGGGGAAAIEALRRAQLSKRLHLIKRVIERWPGTAGERDAIVAAFSRAQQANPARLLEVLGEPMLGAWAAIVNRALLRDTASLDDFRHLAAWSIVACAATGVDGSAEVPVRDGSASVPSIGAATVGPARHARLVAVGGQLQVHADDIVVETTDVRFLPLRVLSATTNGQPIRLSLDDLDPYRHGHHAPPAGRLTDGEVDDWRELFDSAWQLLAKRLPGRADELSRGLRTLVPLVAESGSARSATIRHAFGVFGLTRPPSPAEFAVTLVHEFQHSKLSAMLDLLTLTDPDDDGRYFAPWRTDARPLAGLLQGVYAFVGVADTWRAFRDADAVGPLAEVKFAEARLQVHRGLTAVEQSGALTPDGLALAARLRVTTDVMLAETVPARVIAAAERDLQRTREQWLARNS
jgi:HEXXH motif-containing protein